jgi:hypothetical protein
MLYVLKAGAQAKGQGGSPASRGRACHAAGQHMRTWIPPARLQSRLTIPLCSRAACLDRLRKGPLMISCQLSARLGAHRLSQVSQAQFARLAGLHRDTVRTLHANDWTSIRREVLEPIYPTLQVPVGKLLVGRTHAQARSERAEPGALGAGADLSDVSGLRLHRTNGSYCR